MTEYSLGKARLIPLMNKYSSERIEKSLETEGEIVP